MQLRLAFALLVGSLIATLPRPVRANMAQPVIDGERLAVLAPQGKTAVRVDGETLDFQLSGDLEAATVIATYRMTNPAAADEGADVAFVYVRGDRSDRDDAQGPRAAVQIDGAQVPIRATTDEDPRAPKIPGIDAPRLGLLLFHLDFPAGKQRTVTVRYEQRATVDRAAHVNATSRFEYLLSPAKSWAGFGPLDISIHVPGRTSFQSPLVFQRDGEVYRASLQGLPERELTFAVMSRDGLWFGMTEVYGYWIILITAMMAAAIATGSATRRLWVMRRPWARALLRIFVVGPIAGAASLVVCGLLMAAFPAHALGFGYGGIFGSALLVLLAVPVGAAASAAAASRVRSPF